MDNSFREKQVRTTENCMLHFSAVYFGGTLENEDLVWLGRFDFTLITSKRSPLVQVKTGSQPIKLIALQIVSQFLPLGIPSNMTVK